MSIDLESYNLVYVRKLDGRKFLCKSVSKYDYRLIDTITGELIKDVTQYELRKLYRPSKKVNKRNKKKRQFMNFGKKRVA
jgi:hypothetical protein